jgi:hypothetical protein
MFAKLKKQNPGWRPEVIFGDRAVSEESITEALGQHVKLFFCIWHITTRNMPQHWGKLRNYTQMSEKFRSLAETRTESEYNEKYQAFLEEFPEGATWLKELHKVRDKWVLAWQMHSLTLGYRGTSVAESGNHASKAYLTYHEDAMKDESGLTNVLKGALTYENEMTKQESRETAELEIKQSSLPFANNVYQMTIFKGGYSKFVCVKWGEEMKKSSMIVVTKKHENQRFELLATSSKNGKSYPYTVERKTPQDMYQCNCNRTLRYGYPCSHLLVVLREVFGPQPSTTGLCDTRYIHARWKQEKVHEYHLLWIQNCV